VKRGSTVGALKEQLAAMDPTGDSKAAEFHLGLPIKSDNDRAVALPDSTKLDDEHAELELITRGQDNAGGDRASVDWEAVRDESAKSILAVKGKPYAVLDLEHGASSADIRRAYHRLALLHHPDKGGDPDVFKAVTTAYKSLSEAKDETDGWRDMDGQAVGPWPGHTEMVKGVNVMMFDCFNCPPFESRRLYTGAFQEGCVRCWELSKGEPGKVQPPPRLTGEIHTGGFINDVAMLSPFGLLTAQSAGMKPLPGESLRSWNLMVTPFRKATKKKKGAVKDGGSGKKAIVDANSGKGTVDNVREEGGGEDAAGGGGNDQLAKPAKEYEPLEGASDDLMKSTMIYQHYRGVRSVSLWPRPENRDTVPQHVATVSKDWIALWKINMQGLGLETPATWTYPDPSCGADPAAVRHESENTIWCANTAGIVRSWDVNAGREPVVSVETKSRGWVNGMQLWPGKGVMVCPHTSGLLFFDMRGGKVIRNQFTKTACGGVALLNGDSPMLFAGIGADLMQYDTRMWKDGIDYKPKTLGSWTLRANITSMHCTETGKGHLLVAAGCENGSIAAFDTT